MPIYEVEVNGRTFEIDSPTPPTAEMIARISQTSAPAAPTAPARGRSMIADVGIGAAKGAANTVIGLGQIARRIPGVAALDRVMAPIPINTTPQNTAQRIGYGAEQVGEFFAPVGMVGKAARAAEIGKSALLTQAQTGSPVAAGVSAGLSAVVPGVSAVRSAVRNLRAGAERNMTQALGATTMAHKATAAGLAPQMLTRGVKGSRQTMLDQATSRTAAVGGEIGTAIEQAAKTGTTISGDAIDTVLGNAARTLKVPDATGRLIPIDGTQPVLRKLNSLREFVVSLGPDIPIDRAAKIKTTFQHIVSQAGLYGQKVGASATDSANAWAIREAAGAFKALMNDATPSLAALNAEYAFWKGLKGVLTATVKRTQSQGGGLIAGGMGGSGAIVGAMSGDSPADKAEKAFLYGVAGRQFVKVIQSPYWRTAVTAPMKDKLADALASGNTGNVIHALGKITAALPARVASAAGATR